MSPAGAPTYCFGLAKLDRASGELDAAFAPELGPGAGFFPIDVRALVATDSALYVGGGFYSLDGERSAPSRNWTSPTATLDTFSPRTPTASTGASRV